VQEEEAEALGWRGQEEEVQEEETQVSVTPSR
jgi:hypothetical protein